MKHLIFIILLLFSVSLSFGQKGYSLLTTVPPPHFKNNSNEKDYRLNGLLLSPGGKFLVLDYGRKASTLAIFSFPDFDLKEVHRIEKTVELSQTYFDNNDTLLYLKEDRYAPDYMVINVYNGRKMNVNCERTPRGCPSQAAGFAKIRMYSKDKKYLIQRSKDNKSMLEVFKKD
ncbi:MAG: hypothetical protein C0599_10205 [Salinivirgaceae bacterium]|nr:MAG: hypothetical protein C0599_10205 [Salinivirgaceae bacterium]